MLDKVLSAKLSEYAPSNPLEQDNVLQELIQHYVLTSLSRAGFFAEAVFHGGTCLRIIVSIGFRKTWTFCSRNLTWASDGKII